MITTVGELRAALAAFSDDTPIRAGYAAGTAAGDIASVTPYSDGEFEGAQLTVH